MWIAHAKYGLGLKFSSFFSSSSAFVHRYTKRLRLISSAAITWISGWMSGSPPAIETIGAPLSSIAPIAWATGTRRRSSCSGCWILPQPEQARLHWNSGSSSTISGNFSRFASRWRIRYQPMRVPCLIGTAIAPALPARRPVVKGARHAAQDSRGTQRPGCSLRAQQLVAGAVQDHAHDPERPLPRAGGEPHRLHVHCDSSAGMKLRAPLAERQPRHAHDAPAAHAQSLRSEHRRKCLGPVTTDLLRAVTFIRRRRNLLGDHHFPGL